MHNPQRHHHHLTSQISITENNRLIQNTPAPIATKYFDLDGIAQTIDVNSNKLTDDDIQSILKVFTDRESKEHICKFVSNEAIAKGDYNLSAATYIEQEDTREKVILLDSMRNRRRLFRRRIS